MSGLNILYVSGVRGHIPEVDGPVDLEKIAILVPGPACQLTLFADVSLQVVLYVSAKFGAATVCSFCEKVVSG